MDEHGEMQIREDAPQLAELSSPEKRALGKLARIPEASPGPNAFAQQAARIDRYRLDSNAFYQQEVQRRMQPSLPHPAFRGRSVSDPPTPPRDSICTTMSPFIGAGREPEIPYNLLPPYAHMAKPTPRGVIEERHEQLVHESSGSEEERTPVFTSSSTFDTTVQTPRRRSERVKEVTIIEQPTAEVPAKTPKRSILEKLRLNTSFRSSTSSSAFQGLDVAVQGERIPVKAKAVLGSPPKKSRASFGGSPSKPILPRSPSKRQGLFGRKTSAAVESITDRAKSVLSTRSADFEQPPATAGTVTKTPPTAFSDPTPTQYKYGHGSKVLRTPSHAVLNQTKSKSAETKKSKIVRSQSLKYFDPSIPPTPPAKDTPPDEQAKKEAELAKKASRLPIYNHITPSKSTPVGLVSPNGNLHPARFGHYGYRQPPTLVTQPSTYSLHASVVPDLTEAHTFEEMKARIDGLGLEGFSMPPENTRSPQPGAAYTPSIYSTDWSERAPSTFFNATTPPAPLQVPVQHMKKISEHSKGSSFTSQGTIPVVYPELAKDPSYSDIAAEAGARMRANAHETLGLTVPLHGRTHSRDHSCDSRHERDSAIFAQHVDDDLDTSIVHLTPASSSHPSATPSPLHYLPATTYKPPSRKSARETTPFPSTPASSRGRSTARTPRSYTAVVSPPRPPHPLTTAPTLTATPPAPPNTRSSSPRSPLRRTFATRDLHSVSPVEPSKPLSPSYQTTAMQAPSSISGAPSNPNHVDAIVEMIEYLNSRNHEISSIRDEMRASNFRLGERLAVIEGFGTPTHLAFNGSANDTLTPGMGKEEKRVSSSAAYEFYRGAGGRDEEMARGEDGEHVLEAPGDGDGRMRADTIAELRETNRELLEMVSGFAERIRSLEGRYGAE